MKVTKCRSCHAPVIWAQTLRDKFLPVNPEPSDKGQVTLEEREGKPPLALYHGVKARGITYYVPHWATCPQSKQWRKKNESNTAEIYGT